MVVGVCRADAEADSDVFSSGGWGYDMLSGQAVCARNDSRLRWESKLPTSETQTTALLRLTTLGTADTLCLLQTGGRRRKRGIAWA